MSAQNVLEETSPKSVDALRRALTKPTYVEARMATFPICSIPDCGKPIKNRRGWCQGHYLRWWRYGDPLAGGTMYGEPERFYRETVLTCERGVDDECLTWPYATTPTGYAQMRIDGRTQLVTRRICEETHGPAPSDEHQAAHSCGKGHLRCVTKRHLSWKTPSGNQMDRVEHGTSNRGERCATAKLTEADVLQIRSLHRKVRQRALAQRYGVTVDTISQIQRRERWGWLAAA